MSASGMDVLLLQVTEKKKKKAWSRKGKLALPSVSESQFQGTVFSWTSHPEKNKKNTGRRQCQVTTCTTWTVHVVGFRSDMYS